jgi:hypothetical protein
MKLESFENSGFDFLLFFANGEMISVDIHPLVGKYISESDLNLARIDSEWGCLEFCNGIVDIEPTTLYRYAVSCGSSKQHKGSGERSEQIIS